MSLLDICCLEDGSLQLARSIEGRLFIRRESDWELYDFNKAYQGYYPACTFTALARAGGMFHLAGVDEHSCIHVFVSLLGGVWEEKNLVAQQPMMGPIRVKGEVLRILYDDDSNQTFLLCRNGQLATLPDCPKCVRIMQLQNSPVKDGRVENDTILVEFADGSTQKVLIYDAVQYRVSLDYAYQCLQEDAVVIDLRSQGKYTGEYIHGSINIPFDQLGEFLPKLDPQKPIIFLCRIGIKADEAVLYARRCGFSRAYSLGGTNIFSHIE